ncbi:heat shock protein 27-like [Anthonomus grandis grandis]|uniref:heat shock protein 27-like n=1 Tax=Anthonomus grandis grandis TaxID=2921223 RepID=UPI00216566D7|nr:heat shock protein 27-like [Anthonomus grandis grandis]
MALVPVVLDDLFDIMPRRNWLLDPQEMLQPFRKVLGELEPLEQDTSITIDKDKFLTSIDVQQFKPDELSVRLENNDTVVVEGKHEEKADEHGFISRHFVRKYVLPEGCDIENVQSKLSSDGVLTITAPKKPEGKQIKSKHIPISLTGPIKKIQKQIKERKPKEKNIPIKKA